ncbi:hypothetical protein [Paeniglutamicibacter kerguelensis]
MRQVFGSRPRYRSVSTATNWVTTSPRLGANPGKATIALMISAYKATCDRQDWRHPQADMATCPTTLETWRYQVSTVERVIVDNINQ